MPARSQSGVTPVQYSLWSITTSGGYCNRGGCPARRGNGARYTSSWLRARTDRRGFSRLPNRSFTGFGGFEALKRSAATLPLAKGGRSSKAWLLRVRSKRCPAVADDKEGIVSLAALLFP